MILLIIGIKEGAEIAADLLQKNYPLKVLACNTLCREQMFLAGLQNYLLSEQDVEQLPNILLQEKVQILLDASSETSNKISKLILNLKEKPIYIRYFREELHIPSEPLVVTVPSFKDAIDKTVEMKARTVFLTTGSFGLDQFTSDVRLKETRIVARVLPDWKVVKKCQELGLKSKDIVAMQGPFSARMNKVVFKTYNADLIVSRDSGKMGGADNKISAALDLNIPIIIIKRKLSGEYQTACGMQQLVEVLAEFKEE